MTELTGKCKLTYISLERLFVIISFLQSKNLLLLGFDLTWACTNLVHSATTLEGHVCSFLIVHGTHCFLVVVHSQFFPRRISNDLSLGTIYMFHFM